VIPNFVANSPAVAMRPKRFAARSTWPLASGATLLVTNWSIAFQTASLASARETSALTNAGPATP
jgi:hypothetical protein